MDSVLVIWKWGFSFGYIDTTDLLGVPVILFVRVPIFAGCVFLYFSVVTWLPWMSWWEYYWQRHWSVSNQPCEGWGHPSGCLTLKQIKQSVSQSEFWRLISQTLVQTEWRNFYHHVLVLRNVCKYKQDFESVHHIDLNRCNDNVMCPNCSGTITSCVTFTLLVKILNSNFLSNNLEVANR